MKTQNKLWPLEVCRGLAALYVVMHHSREMLPAPIRPLLLFGQEAVILFFLLSGFVIHYNYSTRPVFDRADFLWKRFVRIYPIFIMVMLLSVVIGGVHTDVRSFGWNLLGMQDSQLQKPGIGYATFGDNDPLWSLGYEVWFYLFYAITGAASFRRNLLLVTVVSVVAAGVFVMYPNKACLTLMYLPIWWLGASLATCDFWLGMGSLVLILAVYIGGSYHEIITSHGTIGLHPFIEIRHFGAAIAFALLWMGAQRWIPARRFEWLAPLAFLAPISYGIYIVHVPLLRLVKQYNGSWFVFLAMTLGMAYLLEITFQKKVVMPLLIKKRKKVAKSGVMKILFIVPSYKPAYIYGGPIVVIARLAERLVRLGHEVTVYSTTANGNKELDVPARVPVMVDGVTVKYFPRITGDHTHVSPALWKHTWDTAKEFDVVHIHSWWSFLVLGASLMCRLRGIKPVLSPHGMFCDYVLTAKNQAKKKVLHNVIGRGLLRHTYLHTSSPMEWNECLQINNSWQGAKIFNLVDLPEGEYPRSENDVFTISFLSRVDPKKGLDILLKALAGVSFPYKLQIAGSGEDAYVAELKALVKQLDIETHVEWVGWKNSETKFPFLAGTDLFALTSHNENFAIVVIESLYVGTPVLISKHVGLSGYVEQNRLGWITGIDDIEEVRAELTLAYNDKLERNRITATAGEIINRDFNENKLAGDYVDLYQKVI